MAKKIFLALFIVIPFFTSQAQELRGTWLSRDQLATKEILASVMDSLATNNFNVVYVNAWSRGYPLWQSDVFYNETGMKTDPAFGNRDVLAEAVAEGHRVGLHVEAWFEYGFVGGWTGNQATGHKGPIYEKHPDWVESTNAGTEIDGSSFYWMIHTRPDVQNFLIGMATEVCRKYDLDGIELDRIRYSSVNYGYDSYTDSLYKSEHSNTAPPSVPTNSDWIKWRADKLNLFAARIYDSIKSVNPKVNVSNAPSLYGTSYTSYNTYCQDWVWWVNNKKVDNVQVQSYLGTPSDFGIVVDYMGTLISDKTKAFPCFAVNPSGTPIVRDSVIKYVQLTRNKGFLGNSIWYYKDIVSYFPYFKSTIYTSKTYPPYTTSDWRTYSSVIKISDTVNAKRTGVWAQNALVGFSGASLKADANSAASIDYYFNVPAKGTYEVYAYIIVSTDRSDSAKYIVYSSDGKSNTKYVDQTSADNRRWYKLGDFALNSGKQLVLKISNAGIKSGKYAGADAAMISLNRKISPNVVTGVKPNSGQNTDKKKDNEVNFNLKSYPNPFNNQAKISFNLETLEPYTFNIFNVIGQKVLSKTYSPNTIGKQEISFETNSLSSGVYIINISQAKKQQSIKLVLSK